MSSVKKMERVAAPALAAPSWAEVETILRARLSRLPWSADQIAAEITFQKNAYEDYQAMMRRIAELERPVRELVDKLPEDERKAMYKELARST